MVRIVCRSREQHASRESDAGFTFVELVVALTVLAVGIVGVIGVTNSSFRVAGGASARSKAVAVATREVEALRAVPYGELAADRNGDGVADCGTVSTTGGWSCYRRTTTTSGGLSFTVERTIQDIKDPDPSDLIPPDKHKEVIVAISWTDQGGSHELHQTSYIYPGGIGLAVAGSTTTVQGNCTPAAPTDLTVSQVTDLVGGVYTLQFETALDLRWTVGTSGCAPSGYMIKYRKAGTDTFHEVTRLATAREFRVPGLTAGTSYEFKVFAIGPSGRVESTGSPMRTGVTGTASLNGCMIGSITVTPSGVPKKANNVSSNLDVAPIVRMPVNGTCTDYDVKYKKTLAGATVTQQMDPTVGAYTETLSVAGPWDVGSRFIDIVERSTGQRVGSVLFTVCEHQVSTCGA